MQPKNVESLLERNRELQARLAEAEETLRAIRNGEVDAVVAAGPDGDAVYTLKGADEGYRLLVEQMAEGAITLTEDGLILFANEQLATVLGLPLERVIGSRIYDFVEPAGRSILSAFLSAPDGSKGELALKRDDGKLVPAYVAASPLRSDGLACTTLVVTDLTAQKRNEEIVAAGELARSILEQAAAAILVLDPDGKIIQANQAAETLAGGSVLLRPFSSVFRLRSCAESKDLTFKEILSTVHAHGTIRGLQATAHLHNDDRVSVLMSAGSLRSVDSESLGCVITLYDIRDLKRTEEALRASETKYRRLFESMQEAFFVAEMVTDDSGSPVDYRFLQANPALERLTGLRHRDLIGRLVTEAMPGVDQDWIESFGNVALTGESAHFEGYSTPLRRWYEAHAYSPQPGQFATAFLDITERKRAEEALRESEARLRATLQSMVDEVWIIDSQGRIILVSEAVSENLGVPKDRWPDIYQALAELETFYPDGTPRPSDEAPLVRCGEKS